MPALAELEAAWLAARADTAYREQLARLQRDFCGRPTPLYHATRLSEAAGRPVWLKREDLMHTGSHKLNNALGQCLLAKRMGKPRIIAETGAGQHGVATATACALLGPGVRRLHGHRGHPAPDAQRAADAAARRDRQRRRRRLVHAQGGGLGRDPRLGRQRGGHALRDRLVRRPRAVPRARARPAARHRRRGARRAARAPRPAALAGRRLRRRRLERDRHLHPVRRRPGAWSSWAARRRARASPPAATARR